MTDQPKRKAIRLPPDAYHDPASTWLVTIATDGRRPAFHDAAFATAFTILLRERIAPPTPTSSSPASCPTMST